MKLKKTDFVEIEYTASTDNQVFDTTDEKLAKENDLEGSSYGPITICIGEGLVLPGLDKALEGKETELTELIMVAFSMAKHFNIDTFKEIEKKVLINEQKIQDERNRSKA